MDCHDFRKQLFTFMDRELDDSSHQKCEQHIERCPQCSRLLYNEQKFEQTVKEKCLEELPPNFIQNIKKKIHSQPEIDKKVVGTFKHYRSVLWLPVSFAAAIAFFVAVFFVGSSNKPVMALVEKAVEEHNSKDYWSSESVNPEYYGKFGFTELAEAVKKIGLLPSSAYRLGVTKMGEKTSARVVCNLLEFNQEVSVYYISSLAKKYDFNDLDAKKIIKNNYNYYYVQNITKPSVFIWQKNSISCILVGHLSQDQILHLVSQLEK